MKTHRLILVFLCMPLLMQLSCVQQKQAILQYNDSKIEIKYGSKLDYNVAVNLDLMPKSAVIDIKYYGCVVELQPALNEAVINNFNKMFKLVDANYNREKIDYYIYPEFVVSGTNKYKISVIVKDKNNAIVETYVDSRIVSYSESVNKKNDSFSQFYVDKECVDFVNELSYLIINTALKNINAAILLNAQNWR